ncbi:hypothetical protein EVAR_32596_1 [Eumeta japonica]|uniref:Uncharacterized protein n=1 Tax=Eumeta variegata TaxID=151549 RepID=A0A4C1WGR8_EUMVA|nr:hypothetical protein EVAR_32596_1 [Eumeta japonica]
MPKRKSQLSEHTSQTRAAKVRQTGETSSEHAQRLASDRGYRWQARARKYSTQRSQQLANHRQSMSEIRDRESSIERSQRLTAAAQIQRTSRIRNRSAPHCNRSAFNYDSNIDYANAECSNNWNNE